MEEPQSAVASYCQDFGDVDEIGDYQCSDVEQGAQSQEHDADILILCPWCDFEVDVSRLICPICGGGLTVFEHGVDSELELSQSSCSQNSESSSRTFNGCPRWPRGVFQPLLEPSQVEQGTVQES